jgi:hypothetical protein
MPQSSKLNNEGLNPSPPTMVLSMKKKDSSVTITLPEDVDAETYVYHMMLIAADAGIDLDGMKETFKMIANA